jgi:hypothetical protein
MQHAHDQRRKSEICCRALQSAAALCEGICSDLQPADLRLGHSADASRSKPLATWDLPNQDPPVAAIPIAVNDCIYLQLMGIPAAGIGAACFPTGA